MSDSPQMPGAIVRIKLKNFMTFNDCQFYPGSRLNIILGPNGSGKSSLVCALGLGLGGNPKLLGRSPHLKEYIKKGEEYAVVEIELKGRPGKENTIIERRIEGNTSKWRVDKKAVPESQVKEVLESYSIQVDNLVQFLPQDRVTEFAQFNEVELLRETIRAVLGNETLKLQAEIAEKQKTLAVLRNNVNTKKAEREILEADIARHEHIVTRQRDRQQLIEDNALLKKKLPWAVFDEAREEALALKQRKVEAEEEYARRAVVLEPLKSALKDTGKAAEKAKREHDSAHKEHKAWEANMTDLQNEIVDLYDKIDDEQKALQSLEARKAKAQQAVQRQAKVVADLEKGIGEQKGEEHYEQLIATLKGKMDPLLAKDRDVRTEVAQTNAKKTKKLNELKSLDRKIAQTGGQDQLQAKQAALEKIRMDCIDKMRWLAPAEKSKLSSLRKETRAKGGRFKGPVFGPLISELSPPNEDVARAMEFAVRAPTWRYVVATTVEDLDTLIHDNLTSILVAHDGSARFQAPRRAFNPDQLSKLGVLGYLDELVKGDPVAVEAARRQGGIQHVLVGTEKTDQLYRTQPERFSQLFRTPSDWTEKVILISPAQRWEITRSRYGDRGETIQLRAHDHNRRLNLPLDKSSPEDVAAAAAQAEQQKAERMEAIKQKEAIAAELAELELSVKKLDEDLNQTSLQLQKLKSERLDVVGMRDKERELASKHKSALDKLKQLEEEAVQDWDARAVKIRAKQASLQSKLKGLCEELTGSEARRCSEILSQLVAAGLVRSQMESERQLLQTQLNTEEQNLRDAENAKKQAADAYQRSVARARELKEKAEETCELTDELHDILSRFPDTSAEIEALIEANNMRVAHILEDPSAVLQYEKRVADRDAIDVFLGENEAKLESDTASLTAAVEAWKAPVLQMASKIDDRIKEFFAKIHQAGYACAGEVALKARNEEDLGSYGMEIQVKFRNEQKMSKLDPAVQSGGERSLTTFLYMLALQELSGVPFRVVDEINQGMDPDKERLAFYRLGDISARSNAQYFLATPKLLPGLAYPKTATILFVFNGMYSLRQQDWDLKSFLNAQRKKRLSINSSASSPTRTIAEPSSEDDIAVDDFRTKRIRAGA